MEVSSPSCVEIVQQCPAYSANPHIAADDVPSVRHVLTVVSATAGAADVTPPVGHRDGPDHLGMQWDAVGITCGCAKSTRNDRNDLKWTK